MSAKRKNRRARVAPPEPPQPREWAAATLLRSVMVVLLVCTALVRAVPVDPGVESLIAGIAVGVSAGGIVAALAAGVVAQLATLLIMALPGVDPALTVSPAFVILAFATAALIAEYTAVEPQAEQYSFDPAFFVKVDDPLHPARTRARARVRGLEAGRDRGRHGSR